MTEQIQSRNVVAAIPNGGDSRSRRQTSNLRKNLFDYSGLIPFLFSPHYLLVDLLLLSYLMLS